MNVTIDLSLDKSVLLQGFISSVTFLLTAQHFLPQIKNLAYYYEFFNNHPLVSTSIKVKSFENSSLKCYSSAAVGGTFDHLHIGHYILLTYAALSADKELYIGITGDQMLKHKNNKQIIQPYEVREQKVIDFIKEIKPHLTLFPHKLSDPYGMAITVSQLQCIVVSQETIKGAQLINKIRLQRQFLSLEVVVCPALGYSIQSKISSSYTRKHILQKSRLTLKDYCSYKEMWFNTINSLSSTVSNLLQEKWFDIIVTKYSEYWRHYHTNQHIYNLLIQSKHNSALDIAIFFHDIVYLPTSTTNEEDSANMLRGFLTECSLMHLYGQIQLLILQTKTHKPSNSLSLSLYDLDMGILDSPKEKYQQYASDIQRQYSYLKDKYKELRKQFLLKQKQQKPLFSFAVTHYYDNIQWELQCLK